MNAMGDDGFLRSILSFWETQTLQIIVFRSVITSHSCFFFHFSNVETFGSFTLRWAAELTTNEADPDDGALSGVLATVTGELPCEALTGNDLLTSESPTTVTGEDEILSESPTGNDELTSESPTAVTNEDEILSESPTVEGLLSGSPTVTDEIPSESNEELESQNPGGFWSTDFRGFLKHFE